MLLFLFVLHPLLAIYFCHLPRIVVLRDADHRARNQLTSSFSYLWPDTLFEFHLAELDRLAKVNYWLHEARDEKVSLLKLPRH